MAYNQSRASKRCLRLPQCHFDLSAIGVAVNEISSGVSDCCGWICGGIRAPTLLTASGDCPRTSTPGNPLSIRTTLFRFALRCPLSLAIGVGRIALRKDKVLGKGWCIVRCSLSHGVERSCAGRASIRSTTRGFESH